MSNFTKSVSDSDFEKNVFESQEVILVDFWASWCGPCRMITPILEDVAKEFQDKAIVYKMDVDENVKIPQRLGIRGIPTLILFKNGKEQERSVGMTSRESIIKLINKYI